MLIQISSSLYASSLFDPDAFKTFQQTIKSEDFVVISALRIK